MRTEVSGGDDARWGGVAWGAWTGDWGGERGRRAGRGVTGGEVSMLMGMVVDDPSLDCSSIFCC